MVHFVKVEKDYPWALLLLADPSKEAIATYIHKSDVYVAYNAEEAVGVFVLEKTGELWNIAVAESFQRRGLGKQLLQHATDVAKQMGLSKIMLGTGNSSIDQLAFYQKAGFRITAIRKNYFAKKYAEPIYENGILCLDMIRLEKNLR